MSETRTERESLLARIAEIERELAAESERVESLHKIGYALQERGERTERELAEAEDKVGETAERWMTFAREVGHRVGCFHSSIPEGNGHILKKIDVAERELAETKAALSKLCDIVNTLKRVHESDNQINQQLRESTEQALAESKSYAARRDEELERGIHWPCCQKYEQCNEVCIPRYKQALAKEKHQRSEDEAQYVMDLQRERDEALQERRAYLAEMAEVTAESNRDLRKRLAAAARERDEAYERAAKVCEDYAAMRWDAYRRSDGPDRANPYVEGQSDAADHCAAAIRALSKPQKK